MTPEYLTPYLGYIKEHKRLFKTAMGNAAVLGMEKSYDRMFQHVFVPILDRYRVVERDRPYIMTFFIHEMMAVIAEWLKNDCDDSMEHVISVIQRCVASRKDVTI